MKLLSKSRLMGLFCIFAAMNSISCQHDTISQGERLRIYCHQDRTLVLLTNIDETTLICAIFTPVYTDCTHSLSSSMSPVSFSAKLRDGRTVNVAVPLGSGCWIDSTGGMSKLFTDSSNLPSPKIMIASADRLAAAKSPREVMDIISSIRSCVTNREQSDY
jgi:hypothetical protein